MERTSKKALALALAASAAALFLTGCSSMCGQPQEVLVKCAGGNACKGAGSCSNPDNSCKGKNGCKSQGWSYTTKSECMARGGRIVD